jgi:hypothetical protein
MVTGAMNALRIVSAVLAILGFVTVAISFLKLQNRMGTVRRSRPVEAQVLRAWMQEKTVSSDDGSTVVYSANYELAYNIDGTLRTATARSNDPFLTSRKAVESRLARHAAGSRGMVHVDPENPSQVHLNLGTNAVTLGLPLWSLVAGVATLLLAISFWFMGTPGQEW